MTDDPDLVLAGEFPPAAREDWLKLVAAALKGGPFEKLTAKTYDQIPVQPLYSGEAKVQPLSARPPAVPWQLLQRVDHPDPVAASLEARHDLENGASGLSVVLAGAIGAHGYGLEPQSIARGLDGVLLDAGIAVELDAGAQAEDAARHLAALVKTRGLAPSSVAIRFGFDPLGAMAASGGSAAPWPELSAALAKNILDLSGQGFAGPFAAADGRIIHAAGGSEAHELAFALAAAVAYLRALEAAGAALEAARRMVFFRLAADADQILTIAKLRAARKLWAGVEEACGLLPAPAFVSAETAWRMMTKRDPWVNLLRGTMAVFAAGTGGANSITVLPFTAALGLPDRFARRLARNTQLILIEESNLAKVGDPAAGTGAIEDVTRQLCGTAWTLFQEIEAVGGAAAALERGLVQEKVARVREVRERAVAHRKLPLTGTSEFPDLAEVPVAVLDVPPVEIPAPAPAAITFPPLPRLRLAEPFEALREASDRRLAATGQRPKVFLATLGRLADFTARATFAKNFFEAGGLEAVTNEGFASREEMIAAFRQSGARLACLCASDEVYAREAVDAAKSLRAARAYLYLAGRPQDAESYRQAGVQSFIYAGCDVVATLQGAHDISPA